MTPASRARVEFRRIVERAPDIIFRYSIDPPRVDYVNPAVEQVLGVPASDFEADPTLVVLLVHPEHLPTLSATSDPVDTKPMTWRCRRADGGYVGLEGYLWPIRDASGRLVAIEGISRDITDKLKTEEALEAVVDSAPVILWVVDDEGRLNTVRGAGLPAIGCRADEAIGRPIAELTVGPAGLGSLVDRALQGEDLVVDITLGPRTLSTVLRPRRDDDGRVIGAMGVSTDITAVRELEAAAARHSGERAAIRSSLQRLDSRMGLDALAQRTSKELLKLRGVDWVNVVGFGTRGLGYVLGSAGVAPAVLAAGRRLPPARAKYLRTRAAQGAWMAPFLPRDEDGSYGLAVAAAGPTGIAYVPLRAGRTTVGLLAVATRSPDGVGLLEQHGSELAEYGTLASALFGEALRDRARVEHVHAEIATVIARRRFSPVFQPIVDLSDRQPVAWEALTRFDDGTPPDRRFAEAVAVGLSHDLELATIGAALEASQALPPGVPLTVNVSPGLVLDVDGLHDLFAGASRPVTLEVSEHDRIEDYDALREALAAIEGIRWSIDDAGSGYASLRHCIELRPHEIKLDRSLVAGADRDPARLAVVAGLRQFAGAIGSRLVAEGVETEDEVAALREVGVMFAQGYLFGRPTRATRMRR